MAEGQGLASMGTGVVNKYGTGAGNTVKHYYAGSMKSKDKKGK